MTALEARRHRTGLALVAAAALCWSTGGLFIRFISADVMTMLFWRGIFSGAAVMLLFFIIEGRRALPMLRALRWPALGVMVASAMSMISGTAAIRYTNVADALAIYATVPFMTAGVAWLAIGERPSPRTMVASLVALLGVIVMLPGAASDGSLFGKGLAVFMTLGMAIMTTIMRRHRDIAMLPAVGLSAWLCSIFCFAFAAPLSVTMQDLMLCVAFGVIQNASGLALYAVGSRRVPAAEATFVAAFEVPLTPLWVWMAIGETPSAATLVGGGIVLAALFGHIALEFRSPRPATAIPPH